MQWARCRSKRRNSRGAVISPSRTSVYRWRNSTQVIGARIYYRGGRYGFRRGGGPGGGEGGGGGGGGPRLNYSRSGLISWAKLFRARFSRLFTVPRLHPVMSAISA